MRLWHHEGERGMTVPWDIKCSWVPTWHCTLMSCISVHQLLGCSQDTQHLQIGWAAQIIGCGWESCWGLAAASEELLVGKVGLHACPVSFPLQASQKHPEELLETHPRRAETAWPLRAGWQFPLVLVCTTTRRGKSRCIQDHQSHLCLCKSSCRKSTQVSELPPSASLLYFHLQPLL